MRMRKKKWVDPYLKIENKYLIRDKFTKDYGLNFDQIYLEIGSGLGDFILNEALNNPKNLYVAFEKDPTCIAISIKKARNLNIDNILFMNKNAMKIEEYFEDNLFDGIYLLFSDPWIKKGYYKRRLTYKDFLFKYQKILKKDSFLYFKTDNQQLFEFSIEQLKESEFNIDIISEDFHREYQTKNLTAYETKFINLKMPIYHIKCTLKKVVCE